MKSYKLLLLIGLIFSCTDDDTNITEGWTVLESPTRNTLTGVTFLNDAFGVINGYSGTLLKTSNTGNDWKILDAGVNISFSNAFIMNNNTFVLARSGLYKTTDGGDTFQELENTSSLSGFVTGIYFFDTNNGIICKSGVIYATSDGGLTWAPTYDALSGHYEIQFTSTTVGYLAGGSTNGGVAGGFFTHGELHKTNDGGRTWYEIENVIIEKAQIRAMDFISDSIGYFTTIEGNLYATQDGGSTWQLRASEYYFLDLVFITENLGYAIRGTAVFKTEDGGRNWMEDFSSPIDELLAITKTPRGNLFVVGRNGMILKKTTF